MGGDYFSAQKDANINNTFSSCCGHPSRALSNKSGGPYHYHRYPTCVAGNKGISPSLDIIELENMADCLDKRLKEVGAAGHSPIIGYMIDGYPIYGPIGTTEKIYTETTENHILRSAYVYNKNTKNYDYQPNETNHLDYCNGIYSATPEYPNGCYHYVLSIQADGEIDESGALKEIGSGNINLKKVKRGNLLNTNTNGNGLDLYLYRDWNKNNTTIITSYPHTTIFYRGVIGEITNFGNFIVTKIPEFNDLKEKMRVEPKNDTKKKQLNIEYERYLLYLENSRKELFEQWEKNKNNLNRDDFLNFQSKIINMTANLFNYEINFESKN